MLWFRDRRRVAKRRISPDSEVWSCALTVKSFPRRGDAENATPSHHLGEDAFGSRAPMNSFRLPLESRLSGFSDAALRI